MEKAVELKGWVENLLKENYPVVANYAPPNWLSKFFSDQGKHIMLNSPGEVEDFCGEFDLEGHSSLVRCFLWKLKGELHSIPNTRTYLDLLEKILSSIQRRKLDKRFPKLKEQMSNFPIKPA